MLVKLTQFHQRVYAQLLRKKLLDLTVFFCALGSACVKPACKILVKLTPGNKIVFHLSLFATLCDVTKVDIYKKVTKK